MIFVAKKKEENGWVSAGYTTTWRMGYDIMLDMTQVIIDNDFKDSVERLDIDPGRGGYIHCIDELKAHGGVVRDCPTVCQESAAIIVSGHSSIWDCPLQLKMLNQTNQIVLWVPTNDLFYEEGNNVYTTYLNSMEILTYVKAWGKE